MNDHLSDMATRIRNAYLVGKKTVSMPHTNLLEAVARVMHDEHYLDSVDVVDGQPGKTLVLKLVYVDGKPAVQSLKRISKPGVRIYQKVKEFRPILSGLGISILSTSQGVMTAYKAKANKLGGEVLVELW